MKATVDTPELLKIMIANSESVAHELRISITHLERVTDSLRALLDTLTREV